MRSRLLLLVVTLATALAVDVGISEHTEKVCDASRTAWVSTRLPHCHLLPVGGVKW